MYKERKESLQRDNGDKMCVCVCEELAKKVCFHFSF